MLPSSVYVISMDVFCISPVWIHHIKRVVSLVFNMWRQLLRRRGSVRVILWQDSSVPSLQRKLSTASRHCVRNSRGQLSGTKASTIENEGTVEPQSLDEKLQRFAKESPRQLLENANTDLDSIPSSPDDIWSNGPYPERSNDKRSQAKHSYRPQKDPKETSIIIFPGQGTQYVGMAKDLLKYPNVREMYEAASQILGYDLLEISLNGPQNELNKTVHQQPAIVVASLAAVEKLRDERPAALELCVGVAGYSVGEITALTFAGALSFEDAIKLVKVRATAMQYASEITPSGMMTVLCGADSRLGFACSVAKEFCQRKGLVDVDCQVASYLYPHCKVIAGNSEALSFIENNKSDFRLKRLKRLPVSGAFHTDLMTPAVEPFREALGKINIDPPIVPVHSNFDGKKYKSVGHIVKQLPNQICSPVKWEQTMHVLYERSTGVAFPKTYECGPNKSLRTILKMCNAKAWDSSVSVEA